MEQIHLKAGIQRNADEFWFELGYSYTEPDFRRIGISRSLKQKLQEKIGYYMGMIFSTTANPSSLRYLKESGFISAGNPYQGFFDHNIVYLEKRLFS